MEAKAEAAEAVDVIVAEEEVTEMIAVMAVEEKAVSKNEAAVQVVEIDLVLKEEAVELTNALTQKALAEDAEERDN